MSNGKFYIPMNFSESSYKALSYGVELAKQSGGSILLHHTVDVQELAESDNPIVVSRDMDRRMKKAETRLLSFSEMISNVHNVQVEVSVSLGNVADRILEKINSIRPALVLFGKSNKRSRLIRNLLHDITVPVIVVPRLAQVRQPSKILFTTDLKPVSPDLLRFLVDMARNDPKQFAFLHIENGNRNGWRKNGTWVDDFSRRFDIDAELILRKNEETVAGILSHVGNDTADLLCTVRRPRSKWTGFFAKHVSIRLAMQSEIPTLVIPQAG